MGNPVAYFGVVVVFIASLMVAQRRGLFTPRSRPWHNALFVAVGMTVFLLAIFLIGAPRVTVLLLVLVRYVLLNHNILLSAFCGAIAGLVMAYTLFLGWRSRN